MSRRGVDFFWGIIGTVALIVLLFWLSVTIAPLGFAGMAIGALLGSRFGYSFHHVRRAFVIGWAFVGGWLGVLITYVIRFVAS